MFETTFECIYREVDLRYFKTVLEIMRLRSCNKFRTSRLGSKIYALVHDEQLFIDCLHGFARALFLAVHVLA